MTSISERQTFITKEMYLNLSTGQNYLLRSENIQTKPQQELIHSKIA